METKICSKCKKEQPISEFQPRGKDGAKIRNECRGCLNAYHRMLYKEKIGKFKRTVREENRESDPKKCIRCEKIKPLSEFTFHNRNKGQHRNFCHDCEKEWIRKYHKTPHGKATRKEWVENNKNKILEYKEVYKNDLIRKEKSRTYHRARWLMLNFNMTVDDYMNLFKQQDAKCAICGASEMNGRRKNFCVDHDHVTGKVRGLLCHSCNVSIGLMKDSPSLLRKAAEYLDSFNNSI